MSCVDEYIQDYVDLYFQPLAKEIFTELSFLLKTLREKGLLRERLGGKFEERRQIIVEAQRNNDAILASFNKYYKFYFDLKQRDSYLSFMKSHGFDDLDLMHLLHSQLIFAFLSNIEAVKNLTNLVLKNSSSDYTLGRLFGKDGIITKQSCAVSKRLDIGLRNALSHYTFLEEGPVIHYYEYRKEKTGTILQENKVHSSDLYKKTIEASLMKAILACLIADLYEGGKLINIG